MSRMQKSIDRQRKRAKAKPAGNKKARHQPATKTSGGRSERIQALAKSLVQRPKGGGVQRRKAGSKRPMLPAYNQATDKSKLPASGKRRHWKRNSKKLQKQGVKVL